MIFAILLSILGATINSNSKLYPYFLSREGVKQESLKNYNGFISNVRYFLRKLDSLEYCNLEPLVGGLHNIMIETLYHCDAEASRARTFNEACSGKFTPDSVHYAVLLRDALLLKGIYADFFSIHNNFYGIVIPCKNKKFYWSILNPVIGHSIWTEVNLVKTYIKYQKPQIDADSKKTKLSDIKYIKAVELVRKLNKKSIIKEIKKESYNIRKKYKVPKTTSRQKATKKQTTIKTSLLGRNFKILNNKKLTKKQVLEVFYGANIESLEVCIKDSNLYKRWILLSYNLTKDGKPYQIKISSGSKETDKLTECIQTQVEKLKYPTGPALIKHYLYFTGIAKQVSLLQEK